MHENFSPLQKARIQFHLTLPAVLQTNDLLIPFAEQPLATQDEKLDKLFPYTHKNALLRFRKETHNKSRNPLLVGVVLSGGQAPGGHNVIAGLFDALKKHHPKSRLIGFLDGPKGILQNQSREITFDLLEPYRNQGGFDLIGSGRDKIETVEQFQQAEKTVRDLHLDGLVIVGGDDSNTNAALLAEYFLSTGCSCSVIGVPKTIDGDLKNSYIETSFGFDTACKIYSETIGNIARDALSAKKYYYFIKLMGRSASHITLECALQTHPNWALIGEEASAEKKTLEQLTNDICDMICQRASQGKNYGVILIPEGIIEFVPEVKKLISELNKILASHEGENTNIMDQLSQESKRCFLSLPKEISDQLLLDRDPHGNVQVSKIETEKLFIKLVENELKERKKQGTYKGKFSAQPQFCGYEGRSGMPSNFDCHYCYALGHVAALLIHGGVTGYMSCVQNLAQTVSEWTIAGIPLVPMMNLEERHGKPKPVIQKALVDLQGAPYLLYKQNRSKWAMEEDYRYPGPIQFFGPPELTDQLSISIKKLS